MALFNPTKPAKPKRLRFERPHQAPADAVWRAWTDAELLRNWWGPDKTAVIECEVDPRVGGKIRIVMEATSEMGKYAGTKWPMAGEFTRFQPTNRLTYHAKSWTEGSEDTTIEHTNDLTITESGSTTSLRLDIAITKIGSNAKMAVFGMKWGYKAQLKKLNALLG